MAQVTVITPKKEFSYSGGRREPLRLGCKFGEVAHQKVGEDGDAQLIGLSNERSHDADWILYWVQP